MLADPVRCEVRCELCRQTLTMRAVWKLAGLTGVQPLSEWPSCVQEISEQRSLPTSTSLQPEILINTKSPLPSLLTETLQSESPVSRNLRRFIF